MKKYISEFSVIVLAVVMAVGSFLILHQFQSQSEKITSLEQRINFNPADFGATLVGVTGNQNDTSTGALNISDLDASKIIPITSYYASAAEVGGYIIGESVFDLNSNGYLKTSGLMSAYVNRAGNYMQVWCGDGYTAVDASSFTNNPISKSPSPLQGYGIQIPDISVASILSITCQQK